MSTLLEMRIDELEEQNAALTATVEALIECLCSMQQQCIGEITMSYRLSAESIGQQIYQATGMTDPELRERLKTPPEHLRQVRADAVRDFVYWGTIEMDPEFAEFEDCAEEFARLGCPSILSGKE